jgi:hypothetical protein
MLQAGLQVIAGLFQKHEPITVTRMFCGKSTGMESGTSFHSSRFAIDHLKSQSLTWHGFRFMKQACIGWMYRVAVSDTSPLLGR